MFPIIIGSILVVASLIATVVFAATLGQASFPRIVARYLENWDSVVLLGACFILAGSLTLLSLAPAEWIGDYSKAGVSIVDQIFVLMTFAYVATAIPGLILSSWWERSKLPHLVG